MKRFLLSAAIITLGLTAVLFSLRCAISRPAIFPAPKFKIDPQLPGGQIVTAHGEHTAYGYYAKGGKRLVVFFHGNGEVMGSMQDLARSMLREGFSVLMAEYPGYGYAAAFKATEQNLYADASLLLKLMHEEYGHTAEDTTLWGFSLGTGVATEMAAQKHGTRLILMAPFTSIPDTAQHHLFFAARWLIADDFNNKAKAPGIQMPTLIVHGERDSVIPFRMGKEPHAEFIAIPEADHGDLPLYFSNAVWKRIGRFAQGS